MSDDRPKYDMHYTGPHCGVDWNSSLQTMDVALIKGKLRIKLGFECWECNFNWWQETVFEIGKIIEDKITVS